MGKLLLLPQKYSSTSSSSPIILLLAFLILLCSITINVQAQNNLKTYTHRYSTFDRTFFNIFNVVPNASINNNALQITPDTASSDFNMYNNSGRVFLPKPFKLWEGTTTAANITTLNNNNNTSDVHRVASFNASFLVNVFRPFNGTAGEGLAFVIAPDMNLPENSYGQYLGLTNASTDGNSTNKIVAVELDTFKQDFDPDDNHVGIDVQGVRSLKTASLSDYNITLAPIGAKFFNVWVDYSGSDMKMQVYIAEQKEKTGPTPQKPVSPILSADLNLMDHVNQISYFGFSASTGNNHTELNCVLRWNLTVHYFPDGKSKWIPIGLGVGIPVLVLLLVGLLMLAYYCRKRRIVLSPKLIGALKSLPGTPREFEFRELKKATNSFDDKNKLGQGGYGVVYKGILVKENNLEIAVKCFSRESLQGQDDFLAELTIINRLRHKHLVRLLGWCHRNGKLLLVYDYMPNGSLDKHLFVGPEVKALSWNLRYKIITGVASALHYLHNEYDQSVVHRDLKASNIMLDSDFNARLGDFGLARALEQGKTSYAEAEGVLGTMGYIAPECFHTGKATKQSDVYAFGAVILEIVCGQRPGAKIAGFNFLVDWVWFLHRDGKLLEAVDPRLGDEFVTEEAQRLLLLGLACSHPMACERPKTHGVLQMVNGTVEVPVVPPLKPPFVWPPVGPLDVDSGSVDLSSVNTSNYESGWSGQYLSRESYTSYNTDSLV